MSELVFSTIAIEIRQALDTEMTDEELVKMLCGFVMNPMNKITLMPDEKFYINKSSASNILNRKAVGGEIPHKIQKRAYNDLVLECIEKNIEEQLFIYIPLPNRKELIKNILYIIRNDSTMDKWKKNELISYADSQNDAKFVGYSLLYSFSVPNVPVDRAALTEFSKRFSDYLSKKIYKPQRKTRDQWIVWMSDDTIRKAIENYIQDLQKQEETLCDSLFQRFENEKSSLPHDLMKTINKKFRDNQDSQAILLLFLWSILGENITTLSFLFTDDGEISSSNLDEKAPVQAVFLALNGESQKEIPKESSNVISQMLRLAYQNGGKLGGFAVIPIYFCVLLVVAIGFAFSRYTEYSPNHTHPIVTVVTEDNTTTAKTTDSNRTSHTTAKTSESASNNSTTSNSTNETTKSTSEISTTPDLTDGTISTTSEEVTSAPQPIVLNKTQLMLNTVGDSKTYQLTCDDLDLRDLNWASSDTTIVSVSQDGKVTALNDGTATITVSAYGLSASCNISVKTSYEEEWSEWSEWTANPIVASDSIEVRTDERSSQVLVSYNMDSFCTRNADNHIRQYRNYSINGQYNAYGLSSAYGEWHHQYAFSVEDVQNAAVIPPGEEQGGSQNGVNMASVNGYSMLYGDAYYTFFITSENYETVTTTYYSSRKRTRTPTVYNN